MKPNQYHKNYLKQFLDFTPQKYQESYQEPNEFYWPWNDHEIHIDFKANDDNKKTVILIHGAGANGRILSMFGSYLFQNGINYYAPDNLGFGLTKVSDGNFVYDDWVKMLCDFVEHLQSRKRNQIFLVGLSVGGMTAYHVASIAKDIKGIIVTTLIDPRDEETLVAIAKNKFVVKPGLGLMKTFSVLIDNIKLPIKWFCKMNLMSRNPEFSKIFENDKLGGGVSIPLKFLRTFTEYIPAVEFEDFNKCPILLLHPEKDDWTPYELSKRNLDKILGKTKFRLLKECGHAPIEEPGIFDIETEVLKFVKENADE